jgi:hypothetical protein
MILVKQSMSVAAKYGLKVCLFDDVNQRVVAYFYDEALAKIVALQINFNTLIDITPMRNRNHKPL